MSTAYWQTSALSPSPPHIEMGSMETVPVAIDVASLLAVGEIIDAGTPPTVQMWKIAPGSKEDATASTVIGSPSVSDPIITVTVQGLAAGELYRLNVSFTVAGKRLQVDLGIRCVI